MASMNTEAVIEAKPEPTTIDLARTAVVVVDMQNDFGAEGGMFHRAGVDISSIRQAIVPTARVLATARKSGVKIVYLKTEYRPDLSDLGPVDSPNWIALKRSRVGERVTTPDGSEGHIMIRDTWNTQIECELVPEPGDIVVSKHRFSGFYGTDLELILRGLGIEYLVFTAAPPASASNRRCGTPCSKISGACSWPIARPSRSDRDCPEATTTPHSSSC